MICSRATWAVATLTAELSREAKTKRLSFGRCFLMTNNMMTLPKHAAVVFTSKHLPSRRRYQNQATGEA